MMLRMSAVVFMVFMALAAPHGAVLRTRTVPTYAILKDRALHLPSSGHVLCDFAKSFAACGEIGNVTDLHR